MRFLLVLSLLAPLSLADPLTEVTRQRYVGTGVAICAVAAGNAHLPLIQTQRGNVRGHLRLVAFNGRDYYESALRGHSVGASRLGGGVVMATRLDNQLIFLEMRLDGSKPRGIDHGRELLDGLKNPRVLRVGATPQGPLVVVAHAGGFLVAGPRPRGCGFSSLIARPRTAALAATPVYDADGNERLDVFVAVAGGRILHLEGTGHGRDFRYRGEFAYQAPGFTPRALVGKGPLLILAGSRNGRAVLMTVPVAGRGKGARTPLQTMDLGPGAIDHVDILDREGIAVAGTLHGQAWVGVVRMRGRKEVLHFAKLPGTRVTALGVNPSRIGWSLAASTSDLTFHILRIVHDPAKPLDWDPTDLPDAERPGDAPGTRIPWPFGPKERGQPKPADPGPRASGVYVVFPRVAADSRRGLDTELVLVYLGVRSARVTLGFYGDDGQLVHRAQAFLRRGRRTRISVSRELLRHRILDFDGYLVIDGASKREMVIEGVMHRGTSAPELLRPYWKGTERDGR